MGGSKNGMYRPIISSIIILVEYNGHITGGYTLLTLYTVYLAVNKFRESCVFNKFTKFNLHKNCIFIEMGVAHECLSMKDGRLNEVIEYSRNYSSMNE